MHLFSSRRDTSLGSCLWLILLLDCTSSVQFLRRLVALVAFAYSLFRDAFAVTVGQPLQDYQEQPPPATVLRDPALFKLWVLDELYNTLADFIYC